MTFLCRLPTTAMQLHVLPDIQVLRIDCWATVAREEDKATHVNWQMKTNFFVSQSLRISELERITHVLSVGPPRAGGWKTPFWICYIITYMLDHQHLPKWTIARLPSSRVLHIECWTTNQGQERPLWIFIRGLCLLGGTVFTSVIERSHCHHLKYAMSDF